MTREQFITGCEKDAATIYVRVEVEGKWKSAALAELPPEKRAELIEEWWTRRKTGEPEPSV